MSLSAGFAEASMLVSVHVNNCQHYSSNSNWRLSWRNFKWWMRRGRNSLTKLSMLCLTAKWRVKWSFTRYVVLGELALRINNILA